MMGTLLLVIFAGLATIIRSYRFATKNLLALKCMNCYLYVEIFVQNSLLSLVRVRCLDLNGARALLLAHSRACLSPQIRKLPCSSPNASVRMSHTVQVPPLLWHQPQGSAQVPAQGVEEALIQLRR